MGEAMTSRYLATQKPLSQSLSESPAAVPGAAGSLCDPVHPGNVPDRQVSAPAYVYRHIKSLLPRHSTVSDEKQTLPLFSLSRRYINDFIPFTFAQLRKIFERKQQHSALIGNSQNLIFIQIINR